MMKLIFLPFLYLFGLIPAGEDLSSQFKTNQLIVVTTPGWDAIQGKLSAYEWKDTKWELVYSNIPVVTGRSGLAWGKGLHEPAIRIGKQKKEGDGNSPAGIYYLSGLFGYQEISSKMNSLKVDTETYCVDDPASKFYNQIVHADTVRKDWYSAETMRMKSDVYKFGIFVDYNVNPPVPGEGSCIFMHIWSGKANPTAGCTAMTEENILKLINFLDKEKNPVLVQLPQSEYDKLKSRYKFP